MVDDDAKRATLVKRRGRWLLPALQTVLCALAVVYLVNKVPWYTRVQLSNESGPRVRVLDQRGDQLVVERAGRTWVVPAAETCRVAVDGRLVPKLELGIRDVAKRLRVVWALCALALFAPVSVLQAYRLVVMVSVQGVALSLWNAVKLTWAGNFFNFALPGTTGGDLLKAYSLSRYTHRKTEVVTAVFFDRVVGLLGLLLLAAGALGATGSVDGGGRLGTVLWLLLGCLTAGSAAVFNPRLRKVLHLRRMAERLPAGRHVVKIGQALVALWRHKGRVAFALLATVFLQLFCTLSAAVMALALGMRGPGGPAAQLWYFMSYVAIGYLIAAVPLTPQAVGILEASYIQFFTRGHWNSASQAVAFALAVRLIQLVWALPGVLVPLLGAHRPRKDELAALERGQDGRGGV